MEFKRGQRLVYVPAGYSILNEPFIGVVGKVKDYGMHIKDPQQRVGSFTWFRDALPHIICVEGGDNQMKAALGSAREYCKEMQAEIKAARDKYASRIEALRKEHMGSDYEPR